MEINIEAEILFYKYIVSFLDSFDIDTVVQTFEHFAHTVSIVKSGESFYVDVKFIRTGNCSYVCDIIISEHVFGAASKEIVTFQSSNELEISSKEYAFIAALNKYIKWRQGTWK